MIFVDTCYLLSLVNTKAKNHEKAKLIRDTIENETKIINSTVLIEMLNNLHKTRYKQVRDEILELIKNINEIDFLNSKDYNNSLKICEYYNYSVNYSDCTILKTMLENKIDTIASFDSDFDKINGIHRIHF